MCRLSLLAFDGRERESVVMKSAVYVLLGLMVVLIASQAQASNRKALVVGNSSYQVRPLKNPANDAQDVAAVLRELGFDVDLLLDASQREMEEAIRDFGSRLSADSVGLFYYAGHAVQHHGHNYMIPLGTAGQITAAEHFRYKAVSVGYLIGVIKQAGNRLNIVVLDACRDNPFRSLARDMGKGLTRGEGAEGTLLAFSTSPNKTAADGQERNSPYTSELLECMKIPNLPVEMVFKRVRQGVKAKTGGEQAPWYEASIDGEFYFKVAGNSEGKVVPDLFLQPSMSKTELIDLKEKAVSISYDGCDMVVEYIGGEKQNFEVKGCGFFDRGIVEVVLSPDAHKIAAIVEKDSPYIGSTKKYYSIQVQDHDGSNVVVLDIERAHCPKNIVWVGNDVVRIYVDRETNVIGFKIDNMVFDNDGVYELSFDKYNYLRRISRVEVQR